MKVKIVGNNGSHIIADVIKKDGDLYYVDGFLSAIHKDDILEFIRHLTNEEKSSQIATQNYCTNKRNMDISFRSAMKMAEWKDQQFIKFLEDRMGDEISVKMIEEFKEMVNG